jgi:hypothetical protein
MAGAIAEIRSPIVELRQYALQPGARETLIELFDREFVDSQEACGISVIGQFRDLDRPDRFVWIRGFDDMESRARALATFYDGPVWAAYRDAANATMIDSDDVLLPKPSRPDSGFQLSAADRRPSGAAEREDGLVAATTVPLRAGGEADFAALFETILRPALEAAGATVIASFVTDNSPNSYPRLPLRADANVFVWFAGFDDEPTHRHHLRRLSAVKAWRDGEAAAAHFTAGDREVLRLQPTARSLLRDAGSTMRR